MTRLTVAITLALLVPACGGDRTREARWQEVERLESRYDESGPELRMERKQRWADGVRTFLEEWPDDPRAVDTWNRLQLDYAEQLEANGRFDRAELHLRDLANRNPENQRATEALARIERRLSLTIRDFETIEEGMSRKEVLGWFGPPRPGWERTEVGPEGITESWFYEDSEGRIRGVHFHDGRVFEVDLD
ncbi:MAG: tetratricopeptide repeat protein [Thermoanaerobaculia bacterium]|nr:tetratricopeptide repeat protein [Thermoanaerobaculia bacterium]